MKVKLIFAIVSLLGTAALSAQVQTTGARGHVVDAVSGEPMPYLPVTFVGSNIGTMTDDEGYFEIENNQGFGTLSFQMLGYETQVIPLKYGKIEEGIKVKMKIDAYGLDAVVVKPKRGRDAAYRRKGNPAVELIREVIAHKEQNDPRSLDRFKVENYERLILSLDKFDIDWENDKFWSHFDFLEKYVDSTAFNQTPVLPISIREVVRDRYYQKKPQREKSYTRMKRLRGLDAALDGEGWSANIEAMFAPVDIYSNDIDIMLNRFVSPISSSMAVGYYKYFISDTIAVDGVPCIHVTFVPENSESYGFTGHLYIVNDGSYALKKYSINVPPHINMNFVSTLAVEEEFERTAEGVWTPSRSNTYARFYIFKKMRQLYGHQMRLYSHFDSTAEIPDGLFSPMADEAIATDAEKYTRLQWDTLRPEPVPEKAAILDSLVKDIQRISRFRGIVKTVETVASGYVTTGEKSKFDFGPIWNVANYNTQEGMRIRIGGMTTANLSDRNFLQGYLAYGFRDRRVKGAGTYIHSFTPKGYHPYEPLRNAVSVGYSYDLDVPGASFKVLDRDHFLMSSFSDKPYQYVRKAFAKYEREFENRLSFNTSFSWENNEAAGLLSYNRIGSDGGLTPVKSFNNVEWSGSLRFAPGEPLSSSRLGKESPFNLAKDAPVVSITHRMGYMDNRFYYNRTDIVAEKRFWLSSFGHIDAALNTGIIWNRVPFPKLYIPSSGQNFLMSPNSFNMMQPMEFVMDRYAAVFATYYLKGWILNRIPLIKRLKLREVVSFSGLYGELSQMNNPLYGHEGLYALPSTTRIISRVPYMEASVGVENIFKLIRVDFVRRITYTDGLSDREKYGIKFTFRLTL